MYYGLDYADISTPKTICVSIYGYAKRASDYSYDDIMYIRRVNSSYDAAPVEIKAKQIDFPKGCIFLKLPYFIPHPIPAPPRTAAKIRAPPESKGVIIYP